MSLKQSTRLILLFLIILALVVGGYGLFIWFIVNVMKGGAAFGLLFVAAVAGVASFFNPCAFPLLPGFIAQYYTTEEQQGGEPNNKKQILFNGFAAALGVISFNVFIGILIGVLGAGFGRSLGLAGDDPSTFVRWLRGIVGGMLVYLGISHATGRGNPFARLAHIWHPKPAQKEQQTNFTKLYSYGFGYTLLGIGCGGPIMGGLFVFSISRGSFADVLLAFAIYSLVMALLMIIVSTLVALSKESLLKMLRQSTVAIQRISGVLLLIVGAFLILSSVFVSTFTRILFP